jgi:hypothetical protein
MSRSRAPPPSRIKPSVLIKTLGLVVNVDAKVETALAWPPAGVPSPLARATADLPAREMCKVSMAGSSPQVIIDKYAAGAVALAGKILRRPAVGPLRPWRRAAWVDANVLVIGHATVSIANPIHDRPLLHRPADDRGRSCWRHAEDRVLTDSQGDWRDAQLAVPDRQWLVTRLRRKRLRGACPTTESVVYDAWRSEGDLIGMVEAEATGAVLSGRSQSDCHRTSPTRLISSRS